MHLGTTKHVIIEASWAVFFHFSQQSSTVSRLSTLQCLDIAASATTKASFLSVKTDFISLRRFSTTDNLFPGPQHSPVSRFS